MKKRKPTTLLPRWIALGALTLAAVGWGAATADGAARPNNSVFECPPIASAAGPYPGRIEKVGATQTIASGSLAVKALVRPEGRIEALEVQWPRGNRHSRILNDVAIPQLVAEVCQNNGSDIQLVTGATNTSRAFVTSLQDALNQTIPIAIGAAT